MKTEMCQAQTSWWEPLADLSPQFSQMQLQPLLYYGSPSQVKMCLCVYVAVCVYVCVCLRLCIRVCVFVCALVFDVLGNSVLVYGAENLWWGLWQWRLCRGCAGEQGRPRFPLPQEGLGGHQVTIATRMRESIARAPCADSPSGEAARSVWRRCFLLSDFVPHLDRKK